jgi:hypothetical protein
MLRIKGRLAHCAPKPKDHSVIEQLFAVLDVWSLRNRRIAGRVLEAAEKVEQERAPLQN